MFESVLVVSRAGECVALAPTPLATRGFGMTAASIEPTARNDAPMRTSSSDWSAG